MYLESAQTYFCDLAELDWKYSLVFAEPSLHIDSEMGRLFWLTKKRTAEIVIVNCKFKEHNQIVRSVSAHSMLKLLNSFIPMLNLLYLTIDLVSYRILFSYSKDYIRSHIYIFGPFLFCAHLLVFLKSSHHLPGSQRWGILLLTLLKLTPWVSVTVRRSVREWNRIGKCPKVALS